MTIKEAILKALGGLRRPADSSEIYDCIADRSYYDFKTPKNAEKYDFCIVGRFYPPR